MSRLWCCGITSNEEKNIQDLVESTKDYVDGFCWTVHTDSKDKTFQILEDNKKEGKITQVPYIKFHDISATFWLHCGAIKNGDWCIINDSKERLTEFWLKKIRQDIEEYNKTEIGAVYCSGRPFLFRFYDCQSFVLTPHWSLSPGPVGKAVIIPEDQKDLYISNKRLSDPTEHFCLHDAKYMWEFGCSNQVTAFYGKFGQSVVDHHEKMRLNFRYTCEKELKLELTLKSLENYLKSTKNYPDWLVKYFEIEFSFSEFFRLKILGERFMEDIVPKREKWSFKDFITHGNGFHNPQYLGARLRYDKEQ